MVHFRAFQAGSTVVKIASIAHTKPADDKTRTLIMIRLQLHRLQSARLLQGIFVKFNLMLTPMIKIARLTQQGESTSNLSKHTMWILDVNFDIV